MVDRIWGMTVGCEPDLDGVRKEAKTEIQAAGMTMKLRWNLLAWDMLESYTYDRESPESGTDTKRNKPP